MNAPVEHVPYASPFKVYETVEWPETGEVFEFTRVKVHHTLTIASEPEKFRAAALMQLVTRVDGRELTAKEIMDMDIDQFGKLMQHIK
jgi:hypothetical protein